MSNGTPTHISPTQTTAGRGRHPATRVAAFGSAHLDVISHVTSNQDTLDRPARMTMSVGGTAHNVAVNLAASGHPVSFGTVLSHTILSKVIIDSMSAKGIDVHAELRPDLPEAGFSAHLHEGHLLSAASSTPIETAVISRELVAKTFTGARVAMVDCNLSVDALRLMRSVAAELAIPLAIAGVSEAKAIKVLDLLGQGRAAKRAAAMDGGPPLAFFLNSIELDFVLKSMVRRNSKFEGSRRQALAELLSGIAHIVETAGEQGVRVWAGDPDTPALEWRPDHAEASSDPHWIGAGDHLMASTLHRWLEGATLAAAAGAASNEVSHRIPVGDSPSATAHLADGNPIEQKFRKLTDTAYTDPLTGLVNRSGLKEFSAGRDPEQPSALVMIDLDHFKSINDVYGHDIGDVVLRRMGGILRVAVRDDDCACRWGGEELLVVLDMREFAALPPAKRLDAAVGVAERIRVCVETADWAPCRPVTCSIGVAVGHIHSIDDMRDRADKALYEAKRGGRNQVRAALE